jgi:hypothetical protein
VYRSGFPREARGMTAEEEKIPHALRDVPYWQWIRGRHAYDAWRARLGGVLPAAGGPIPEWNHLPPDLMRAWIEAACSVCSAFGAIY